MKHSNNEESCFVCRRRADGIGIGNEKRVGWMCSECASVGKVVYHMPDREFDIYEQRAIERAGEKAGDYLDTLGKTDLGNLTKTEWRLFLNTVVRAFGDAIRSEINSGKAPF